MLRLALLKNKIWYNNCGYWKKDIILLYKWYINRVLHFKCVFTCAKYCMCFAAKRCHDIQHRRHFAEWCL